MLRIDLEELFMHKEYLDKINRESLDNIEWFKDGKKVNISDMAKNDFMFTGLNNVDFILFGYFLLPSSEKEKKASPRYI